MSEMIAMSDFDDDDRHYMKWMSKKIGGYLTNRHSSR